MRVKLGRCQPEDISTQKKIKLKPRVERKEVFEKEQQLMEFDTSNGFQNVIFLSSNETHPIFQANQGNAQFPGFVLKKTVIHSMNTNQQEECYCLGTAVNRDRSVLAVSSSTNVIKLYDYKTLDYIGKIDGSEKILHFINQSGHQSTVNEMVFVNTHNDILLSASSDRTIRVWDTRAKTTGQTYSGSF